MNIVYLLQNILNGLSIGSVYAIFALGYTLVFSILGIINFAHGAVFTLGAYCTYALAVGDFGLNGLLAGTSLPFSLPFPLALLGGSVMAGFVGVLVERLAFRPLRAKGADPLLALVSSLGVALILVNCLQFLVGAEIYSFPSGIFGSLPMAMIFKMDGKILAVPTQKLLPAYDKINSLEDIHELTLKQISHFFEHYKDLEKGKWVKVLGWKGVEEAKKEVVDGIANYKG